MGRGTDEIFEYASASGMDACSAAEFAQSYIDNEAWEVNAHDYAEALYDYQNSIGAWAPDLSRPENYNPLDLIDDDIVYDYDMVYNPPTDDYDNGTYRFGCEFDGVKQIAEYEDDLIYIPTSYYCGIKCIEKYLNVKTDRVGASQFGNSSQTIFKYFEDRDYNRNILPAIYKHDKETGQWVKMNKHHITSSSAALICVRIIKEDYHLCLVKDRSVLFKKSNTFLTMDVVASLIKYRKEVTLTNDWIKTKDYEPKTIKNRHCIFYDIETYGKPVYAVDKKDPKEKKLVYNTQVAYGLAWTYHFLSKSVTNVELDKIKESVKLICSDDCIEIFIDSVIEFCKNNKITEVNVFAHNGGAFDHQFVYKSKTLKFVSDISGGSRIKCLTAIKDGITMNFLDSFAYLQASLASSCKSLKLDKKYWKQADFNIVGFTKEKYETTEEWKEYLLYDVISLTACVLLFNKMFENEYQICILSGVGISSLAYQTMSKTCNFLGETYLAKDPVTIKFLRASCYGGRVLHWKNIFLKDVDGGELISIDANSLYPSAMACFPYPIGQPISFNEGEITVEMLHDFIEKGYHFIAEIEFSTGNQAYPIIPYKDETGMLCYKNGDNLRGVYNSVDIEEMLIENYKITKVYRCIKWLRSAKIFDPFVAKVYEDRKIYKEQGNGLEYCIKILLNSCYGKYLQNIKEIIKFSDKEAAKPSEQRYKKKVNLPNGQIKYVYNNEHAISSAPIQIGSFILSYSKKIMNRFMRKIGRQNIYYSDTDSLYCTTQSFMDSGIAEDKDLCGVKNDYGDGKYITKAIFLDQKRYLLKFSDGSAKVKFNGLQFKTNKNGEGYDKEGFLTNFYKFDALNTDTNELQPGKEVIKRSFVALEKIFTEFVRNPEFSLELAQEKWSRVDNTININYQDMLYQVNPNKKGAWKTEFVISFSPVYTDDTQKTIVIDHETKQPMILTYEYKKFYPIGYDYTKPGIGESHTDYAKINENLKATVSNYTYGPFRLKGNVPVSTELPKEIKKEDFVTKFGVDLSRVLDYETFFRLADGNIIRKLKGAYYFIDRYGINRKINPEEGEDDLQFVEKINRNIARVILSVSSKAKFCSTVIPDAELAVLVDNFVGQLKAATVKYSGKKDKK